MAGGVLDDGGARGRLQKRAFRVKSAHEWRKVGGIV